MKEAIDWHVNGMLDCRNTEHNNIIFYTLDM